MHLTGIGQASIADLAKKQQKQKLQNHHKKKTTKTEYSPEKNLWDWLQLLGVLAIPVVVGLGTAWFTKRQAKESAAENEDNQREAALQTYIKAMSELLLEKKLRKSKPKDEVRTITVLFQLDARRIGYIFAFLRESGLMSNQTSSSIVTSDKADFRQIKFSKTDLHEANLSDAYLRGADLSGANLSFAFLNRSGLSEANLWRTDLTVTILEGAILEGAILTEASLYRADLRGANLTEADLRETKMDNETDLGGTKLQGAKYNTKVMQVKDEQGNPITIEKTQWPSDFNFERLKDAGANCVDCETP